MHINLNGGTLSRFLIPRYEFISCKLSEGQVKGAGDIRTQTSERDYTATGPLTAGLVGWVAVDTLETLIETHYNKRLQPVAGFSH